jgi:hypothetical protein
VDTNLNHPNILRVVDGDLNDKAPFYVGEWCEAGSLEKIGGESFRGNITLCLSPHHDYDHRKSEPPVTARDRVD